MLHGVLRCGQDFALLFPALAAQWQVAAVDLGGHGGSSSRGGYRVIDYVDDVGAVLERWSQPAVVYGHSLGAMLAIAVAARYPRKVRAIVLEDPPLETLGSRLGETPFLAQFLAMRELARQYTTRETDGSRKPVDAATVAELTARLADLPIAAPGQHTTERLGDLRDAASLRWSARCLMSVDPEVLTPLVEGRWLADYDTDRLLAAVECPALILQADHTVGGMLLDHDAQRMVAGIKDSTLVRLRGVGHLVHWVEPAATLSYVSAFLSSLD